MTDDTLTTSPVAEPVRTFVATPDGDLPAQLWLPPSGTGPGIVVVQEIFGVGAYVRSRARDLAELGSVVLVPELYWRLGLTATAESGPEALSEGMDAAGRLGLSDAISDTRLALDALRARPEVTGAVALVGFCFGGGVAVAAAAENAPDALVSFYGSSLPAHAHLASSVTCPSLHHWGDADPYIPFEVQEELRAAFVHGDDQQWFTYPGAGHAFDNPNPPFHHAEASHLAWERTVAFFAAHLPRGQ